MSVRKITFLKLNNVNVCIHDFQYMTLDKITQQLLQLQLKYSIDQLETILYRYVRIRIANKLRPIRIANKSDEKREFDILSYQDQSILFFAFQSSRKFHVTEKQYDDFLFDIVEFVIIIQSIHDVVIKINA